MPSTVFATFTLRRWLSLLLILVLAIASTFILGACRPLELTTGAAQVPQLVLTTLQDPKTFNYALNQEFPNVFLFTYQGLTTENGITGEIEPALAESWEISDDERRIVFTLREELKWSDGEPLTADDVVFTYEEVIFNKQIPTDAEDNLKIGPSGAFPKVRKIDDRRVEFMLPEPFAPFLRTTTGPPTEVAILPKHALQESVHSTGSDGNPRFLSVWGVDTNPAEIVVNGPYQIESYATSQRAVFRRNPYYWRQDAQGHRLPYIERIVWQFIESTDTQLLSFRSGGLDVMGDVRPLRPEYFPLLKREERLRNFEIYNGGPWSGTTFISFNLTKARNTKGQPFVDPVKSRWFNTLAFRQAIAHAINRRQMINNIFQGIGVIQNSPISVQSPYFLSPKEGLEVYDYDLNQARELLLKAGFQYSSQGQLLDAEGNQVRFTLLTNSGNKLREAIGAQIKQDLSKIGIQVDFNPINFNTLVSKLTDSRDWDCHLIGFTGGIEPNSGANLWTSRGGSHNFNMGPQPGQPPITGWEVSSWEQEIDRLFIAGARELDEVKRKAIYADFQRIVQEQLPVIHLVNEIALAAVRDRIQGLKYSGLPSWGLWNIDELKIGEDR
jgi:peptide/nickel transport system substrate-binding protein